jgi:Fe-S cluster assembly iron-binding protein IscA
MQVKLEVTKEARTQVEQLIRTQKPGTAVRVYLQSSGGGCGSGGGSCGCGSGGGGGGTSFGMAFDRQRNGDEVIPVDGFNVVVDAGAAGALDGATIDFVQNLDESGFKINAPLLAETPREGAGGGCGCGSGGCC